MKRDAQRRFVLVTGDFVRTGGQDYANFALADYLSRQGHPLDLVAYRADPELLASSSVRLHRVPKPARSYTLGSPILRAAGLLQWVRSRREGAVVVTNGGACPAPSVNWVHYVHAAYRSDASVGSQRARNAVRHPLNVLNEAVALRAAHVVIANSNRTKRDVVERVGVDPAKVHTVYYGIDAARFRAVSASEKKEALAELGWSGSRFRIAFIGALGDRRKGFDTVFEAWSRLCKSPRWDGELVVVGSGAELDTWRARSDDMGDRIRFLGFRKDVPRILAASDALVSPTRYEAYGLGVHEALCTGLPALVTSDAGVAERYDGALRSVLIDDPNDAAALESQLREVRRDYERIAGLTRKLGEQLRSRSWDDMATDIERLSQLA